MNGTVRFSRRSFLRAAATLSGGALLAACTLPDTGTGMEAEATEPVVLQALWVAQTALVEYFENYSATIFSPQNDGAMVEFTLAPGNEIPQKMLSGIAAGDPADLFRVVNVAAFTQLAANDIILALDDLIDRDGYQDYIDTFIPGTVETFNFNGIQYGIPFGAHPSSQYLFYNKTALNDQGIVLDDPGWSWADYVEVAKTVTDPDNDVFGSWVRANFEGYMVGVRSMGGDLLNADGTQSQINSDEAWEFWNLLYALINEHKTTVQPTDVRDWKPPFAEQKIMMANDNGYRESFLREMVQDFEFDTFLIPNMGDVPRGGLVGDISAISAASSHHDLAWEWVKGTLATEEGIKRVQNARFIPLPTEAALLHEDAMVSHQYEFYVRQWINEPPLPAPTAGNGRTSDVFSTLQRGMEAAWLATEPLTDVVNSVDKEIQDILDMPPA